MLKFKIDGINKHNGADFNDALRRANDETYVKFLCGEMGNGILNVEEDDYAPKLIGNLVIMGLSASIIREGEVKYKFSPQNSYFTDTRIGNAAMDEFMSALQNGADHNQAELAASNYLQRNGYNVNARGGVSIDLDKAQFEAQYNGHATISNIFERKADGAYKHNFVQVEWLKWRAGWIACSAQQSTENDALRAALQALLHNGNFFEIDDATIEKFVTSSNADSIMHTKEGAEATLKARALLAGHAVSAQQAPVKAVALKFGDCYGGTRNAYTVFGTYRIHDPSGDGGYWPSFEFNEIEIDGQWPEYLTLDSAIAICQSDFNRIVNTLIDWPKS